MEQPLATNFTDKLIKSLPSIQEKQLSNSIRAQLERYSQELKVKVDLFFEEFDRPLSRGEAMNGKNSWLTSNGMKSGEWLVWLHKKKHIRAVTTPRNRWFLFPAKERRPDFELIEEYLKERDYK